MLVSLLALGGLRCGDDPKPVAKKPAAPAPKAEAPAEKAIDDAAEASPDAVAEIAYAYSPIGKRDPFRSLFDQLAADDESQQLTELQKFEVDQLKLVGIITRVPNPYAMVEDPNGKGHTLRRGTLVGKNWGRISQITPDCVAIKEEYRDYTGAKQSHKLSLCLPKPEDLKVD